MAADGRTHYVVEAEPGWVGGWVGGWVCGLGWVGGGERGGSNELLWVWGGWVGGKMIEEERGCLLWVGG